MNPGERCQRPGLEWEQCSDVLCTVKVDLTGFADRSDVGQETKRGSKSECEVWARASGR